MPLATRRAGQVVQKTNTAPTGTTRTVAITPTLASSALAATNSTGPSSAVGNNDERLMPCNLDSANRAKASGNNHTLSSPTTIIAIATSDRNPDESIRPLLYAVGKRRNRPTRTGPRKANGARVSKR